MILANDIKTMLQAPATVGRTVEPRMDPQETSATPGDYHEYMGSKSVASENSYTASRRDGLVAALGNKDSVKG